jgi:hypothetical protein
MRLKQQTLTIIRLSEIRLSQIPLAPTIMKLVGYDRGKFTYHYAGRDFRLTDVHGKVVEELIA